MAPKRRKLSLDEGDSSDRDCKNRELPLPVMEKDLTLDKEAKVSSQNGESLLDSKGAKDEGPKPTRISERLIIKRNRQGDIEEEAQQVQAQVQTPPKKVKEVKSRGKKKKIRKPKAFWSMWDKTLFFSGLGEYGRNFEAISNKISNVARLRQLPQKDKMQVRYFYYRCWAKISKFIKMNMKGVKQVTQELYGLINYGVLKKHLKETDSQFEHCLNELIHQGETTYVSKNVKGKKMRTVKVRTPVCTWLKKLNKIEEKHIIEPKATGKLPSLIAVELTPKNYQSWARVQSLSQNPRVRIKMTANRTLESIFKYLEKKWKPPRVKLKEGLGGSEERNQELVCFFHPTCKITPVDLIPQERQRVDVAFESYRENILPTLLKRKKRRGNKDSEKDQESESRETASEVQNPLNGASGNISCPSVNNTNGTNPSFLRENIPPGNGYTISPMASLLAAAAKDLAAFSASEAENVTAFSASEAEIVTSSGVKNVLADSPVGTKPPAALLEDENAMFPDISSPPLNTVPSSAGDNFPSPPSEPLSKQSVISSPPPLLLSSSSSLSPTPIVIASPPCNKKKPVKGSKKHTSSAEDPSTSSASVTTPATAISSSATAFSDDNKDNLRLVSCSGDNSASPTKAEAVTGTTGSQDLKEESNRDIVRITDLAAGGFTLKNSDTVTLLHLSLVLGRQNTIRLEYEWRPRKKPKCTAPPPPLFCQSSSKMSNLLRRLCNIATLELTEFTTKPTFLDQGKSQLPVKGTVPCSQSGDVGPPSKLGGTKRQSLSERKDGTKEMSTMTEPLKLYPPLVTSMQMFNSGPVLGAPRTFVAAPTSVPNVQVNRGDPVFRVPLVPSFKQGPSREEQQQAAKIMQTEPKSKLLRRRPLASRAKKPQQIIVQRTLLPKYEPNQVFAYIQPASPAAPSQMVVSVSRDNMVQIGHPVASIVESTSVSRQTKTKDTSIDQRSDILMLAAQSAEITEESVPSPQKRPENSGLLSTVPCTVGVDFITALTPLSGTPVTTASTSLPVGNPSSNNRISEISEPSLMAQGDISISDFDISLSSVGGSNMGPDAGDKFLDMVLQNSEQGFSGLIDAQIKNESVEMDNALVVSIASSRFDPSVLRTPPHAGISSSYLHTPTHTMFSSPLKLSIPDAAWINSDSGDISLSSFLNHSSSSYDHKDADKSQDKSYAAFFDCSSSDAQDSSPLTFKQSQVADLTLSSLLGDPSFSKKDEPAGMSPVVVIATSQENLRREHSESLFSAATTTSYGPPQLFSEASQDSIAKLDVDGALQGMVNESSLDLVSKFESLAAHITERQDREMPVAGLDQDGKTDKLMPGSPMVEHMVKETLPAVTS